MTSVKKITCVESHREPKGRNHRKSEINYKDISSEDEVSFSGMDEEVVVEKSKRNKVKSIDKSKKARNVVVQNKATNSELNLLTQYKNRKKFCDRELFKVDRESGSKDKEKQKFVYLCFKTGLFEAMKKNMVKIILPSHGNRA